MDPIYTEEEVLDTLLTVIINDNRSFKGTPPPMYKRKAHIRKASKLYDKIMRARNPKK